MKYCVMYIVSLLIFGSNGVFASHIDMTSAEIVCMRTLIGSLALILVLLVSRTKLDWAVMKREAFRLIAAGICLGVNWALLFEAYKLMSVSIATLTYYLAPIIVLLLSPLLLREKQSARAYIGMCAAVVGLVLAVGLGDTSVTATGLIVGLGSAVFYAGLIIFNKKIDGVTGLACWLYFSSMNRLPARAVALFGYVDPVSALIFSAVFLGDRMGVLQIAGAVLVFAGAAFGQSKPKAQTLTQNDL